MPPRPRLRGRFPGRAARVPRHRHEAKIFKTPTPVDAAVAQVDAWLASPSVVTLHEERDGYWELLSRLLKAGRIHGAKVHDARVAALVLFHGAEVLLTADRDFSRFPDLVTRNPLA